MADAIISGRATVMQRTGQAVRAEGDEWKLAKSSEVARLSLQWEGLRFLVQECVPHLMEVRGVVWEWGGKLGFFKYTLVFTLRS